MKKPDFLKRLQQGNVLRSAISYVAVSWLIIQVCLSLFELFGISQDYVRLIVIGLIIVFPIWLAVTYFYDYSKKGFVKVDHEELDEETLIKRKTELNKIIITGLSLAVIFLLLDKLQVFSIANKTQIKSIAVIPFKNISSNVSETYFVDGIQDELIGSLSLLNKFRIPSRTSTDRYRETEKSIQQIADELSVDAIIEGSVLRYDDNLRIQIKLIQAFPIEKTILSQSYDRPISDVLEIHQDVTKDVAKEVKLVLSDAIEDEFPEVRKVDPKAYDLYLRGIFNLSLFTPPAMLENLNIFNEVIKIDPDFYGGYTGLSYTNLFMMVLGMVNPLDVHDLIMENAKKGVELGPNNYDAHGAMAGAYVWGDYNWEMGEQEFKRSLELNPNNSFNNIYYAHLLACLGRFEEATKYANIATQNDQFNPFVHGLKAVVYVAQEKFQAADSIAQVAIKMGPNNPFANWPRSHAQNALGNVEEAFELFISFQKLVGNIELAEFMENEKEKNGNQSAYEKAADFLVQARNQAYVPPHVIYQFYNFAKNDEKVLEWLKIAYDERSHDLSYLGVLPFQKEVKNDTIYKNLIKKLKLPHVN